jgi:hypothetical protein
VCFYLYFEILPLTIALSFFVHALFLLFAKILGGSGGSASAKLQAETNSDIKAMETQFDGNVPKAIDVLLSKCCEVSLDVPTARIRSTQKIFG